MGKKIVSNVLRVVIDTNLILSALIFKGNVAKLRFAWQNNRFTPLASKATITELIRVLAYPKFKLNIIEQEDLLSDYLPYCETIKMPRNLPTIPECRDRFDQPFLLLAMVGKADYLITGDQDLLSIEDDFICPILTMEQFFSQIDNS
jgi:putative PIN family toxin of toxin-antitoxin system